MTVETLRPNSQTSTYKYDHSGQRVEQNISSGAKVTVYPNKYYEKTTEGEDESETLNIYAQGQLVGTVQAAGSSFNLYFVHPDHLNSSSVMTNFDETGSVDQVIDYTPFGGLRFNEQNSSQNIERKFTGHIADDSTTLQYFGARYYQGDVGRFWSEDPVFLESGGANLVDKWRSNLISPQLANSYSYASNNPLKYIDPLGMYNTETGQVEKGDTPDSIVSSINSTFGINTNWDTVKNVSFYSDRFGNQSLDQIVGQSLRIGTNVTADITDKLNNLNFTRSLLAGNKTSLILFAPHGPWDIKNSSDPILGGGKDRTIWSYIYNGELIRYDAPGNINYGYVARSLGLSDMDIKGGAAIEQLGDNLLNGRGLSFTDNKGDSAYVQKGINAYNSRPWWQKLLKW